jgi:hypothetical protein
VAALFRLRRLGVYAIVGVAACAANSTSRDTVEITGEFFPDGSCRVAADGVALFAPAENARTLHDAGFGSNVAPDGYVLHELYCSPLRHGIPTLDGDRIFSLSFGVKGNGPAATGTYAVERHIARTAVPMTMAGAYLDPRHYSPDAKGDIPSGGKIFLIGVSGTASFTRLDSAKVVGEFRFRALREWSQ